MEESATKIGSKGEKIAMRDLAVFAVKQGHGRDNWEVTDVTPNRSESRT